MSEKIYRGIGVSEGIRMGKAFIFEKNTLVNTQADIAEKIEEELTSLQDAAKKSSDEIDSLIERSSEVLGKDKIGVLKGQKSILSDPAYLPEIEKLIRKKCYSSAKAVKTVTEKFAKLFESMPNPYMQERASDVRDAGSRLLNKLSGETAPSLSEIGDPVILIADDLSPSDTIQLDKNKILAFITQKGGKTSHTAIFAKSLGIPAIVGAAGIMQEAVNGTAVLIDSAHDVCILSPEVSTIQKYEEMSRAESEKQQAYELFAHQETSTADGKRITSAANIGSAADAEYALAQGAEEIGLLRTELLYLSSTSMPGEEEQFEVFRKIALMMQDRSIIIRTLDIGGDKALSYLSIPKEENPFLGYRAIRLCLDQKELFLTQLRAILRASAFGKLKIMFPMISNLEELRAAKACVDKAKSQLRTAGIPFDENIPVGIMIEIPSAALTADALAKESDFFSIGTNDLTQYTLAVDRGNSKIAHLYEYYHPAVLKLIHMTAQAAKAQDIPVGMCGGMAGDAKAIPLLIGLGLDELSMAAGNIKLAKYTIHGLQSKNCAGLAKKALQCSSAEEVKALL